MQVEGIPGSWLTAKAAPRAGNWQRVDITVKIDGKTYQIEKMVQRDNATR